MGRLSGTNYEGGQSLAKAPDLQDALPKEASMGERIWAGAKNLGKEIVRGTVQSLGRIGVGGSILMDTALGQASKQDYDKQFGGGLDLGTFGKADLLYKGNVRQQQAEIWSDAVNAALLSTAPEFGAAAKAGGVEAVAKEALKTKLKHTAFDASLGAGFGIANELEQDKPSLAHGAKTAAEMAVITAALPHVLGFGLRGASSFLGKARDELASAVDNTATRLEKYAAPDKAASEFATPIEKMYGVADAGTPKQQMAGRIAESLRKVQEFPNTVAYHLDRWNPVKRLIDDVAVKNGQESPAAELTMRAGTEAGANRAVYRWQTEYLTKMQEYGDVWNAGKAIATAKDEINRAGLGLDISSGRTAEELQAVLNETKNSMSPDQWQRANEAAKFHSQFNDKTLSDLVESGLVTEKAAQAMRTLHPDYIPHDVADYFDDAGQFSPPTRGKTANISNTGLNRAKGSERALRDLDLTQQSRLTKLYVKMENSKAVREMFKAGETYNPDNFINVQSSDKVLQKREIYDKLRPLIDERDEMRDAISGVKKVIGQSGKEAATLERQTNELLDEAERLSAELQTSPAVIRAVKNVEQRILKASELDTLKVDAESSVKELQALAADQKADAATFREAVNTAEKEYTSIQKTKKAFDKVNKGSASYEQAFGVTFGKGETAEKQLVKAVNEMKAYDEVVNATRTAISDAKEILRNAKGESTETQRELKQFVDEAARLVKEGKSNPTVERLLNRAIRREERAQVLRAKQVQFERVKGYLDTAVSERKEAIGNLREELKSLRQNPPKTVDLPEGYGLISWYDKGVKEIGLVPKDIEKAVKYLDSETVKATEHWFFKLLQTPARIQRTLATSLNPSFALIKNAIRDIQEQSVTTAGRNVRPIDYARTNLENITGNKKTVEQFSEALGDHANFKLKGELDEAQKYGVKTLKELAEFSGAFRGTLYHEGLDPTKQLKTLMNKGENPFWKVIKRSNPVKAIEDIGQHMEEMSRLAAFRRGLQEGMTAKEAAFFARDATVDFNRYGPLLQTANKYVPFLNARVQGFRNLTKAVADRPEAVARALMWSAAVPTVGLYAYNTRFDSYKNISDEIKRNYWILMYGEENAVGKDGKRQKMPLFFVIPKGNAQQPVSDAIELSLRYGEKNHPKETAKYLSRFAQDLSPVSNSSLLPAGVRQAVDLQSNYDSFREKQIEPDQIKTAAGFIPSKELKPYQRADAFTSTAAKYLGKVTGWSPKKIDFMLGNLGVLSDVAKIPDMGKQKGSPLLQATSYPVVGSLIRTSGGAEKKDRANAAAEKAQEKNEARVTSAEYRAKIRQAKRDGNAALVAKLTDEYAKYRQSLKR